MTQGNSSGEQLLAELRQKYPLIIGTQNPVLLQLELATVQRTMPDPETSSQQERRSWGISLSTLSVSAKAAAAVLYLTALGVSDDVIRQRLERMSAAADKIAFLFETIERNWLR